MLSRFRGVPPERKQPLYTETDYSVDLTSALQSRDRIREGVASLQRQKDASKAPEAKEVVFGEQLTLDTSPKGET